jgi:hypothetical protein
VVRPRPDPEAAPGDRVLPTVPGAMREPGPACFGGPGVPSIPVPEASAFVSAVEVAALAEQVLRSLRVGTDGHGRSLVLLDFASGALAGCQVELRRVAGGVSVAVRGERGAADPRERDVVAALRRRGVEVV